MCPGRAYEHDLEWTRLTRQPCQILDLVKAGHSEDQRLAFVLNASHGLSFSSLAVEQRLNGRVETHKSIV